MTNAFFVTTYLFGQTQHAVDYECRPAATSVDVR
jgi:hypothetical protein